MPPIRLSNDEIDAVFAAARPIDRDQRDAFLLAVAGALKGCGEVGPGTVHRVCVELQAQFFDPPNLDRGHVPRWSSRRANGIRATKATALRLALPTGP